VLTLKCKESPFSLYKKRTNESQVMPEPQFIELPPGPVEGGGGGGFRPPRPGIEELPVGPVYERETVTELFRLRDRVHALESQALAARINPQFKFPGWPRPYELPQVSEALFLRPGVGGPNELPPPDVAQLVQNINAILQRLTAIEATLATLATAGASTSR
jgi:hypothetical protein